MKVYFLFLIFFLFSCSGGEKNTSQVFHDTENKMNISEFEKKQIPLSQTGVFQEEIFQENQTLQLQEEVYDMLGAHSGEYILGFTGDASITKYINHQIHYDDIKYIPSDLVPIKSKYIYDTKGNQTLRIEANEALQLLAADFYEYFKIPLKVVSAYRSYEYQVGIKKGGCSDIFCAKPGYSEHQSGLAVDFFEATSQKEFLSKKDLKKYFEWLSLHAHIYGFHNSYQKGKEVDGYTIEPWHWRYLGKEFATELWENKMTYGEYYIKFGQK